MTKITQKELEKIIENHQHWLKEDCDGWENMRANLSGANLSGANLRYANLSGANLRYANLSCANLSCANLRGANLRYANLSCANLSCANLRGANLRGANLYDANLSDANLYDANLSDANLSGANLSYANLSGANLSYANLYDANLSDANLSGANLSYAEGSLLEYRKGKVLTKSIIGYKKCRNDIIVKLEIPRGAVVFSINGKKCRTNKAKVLDISGADRAISEYKYMSYYVGDEFTVYNFNYEYNMECASGIHFFMTKEEAKEYI